MTPRTTRPSTRLVALVLTGALMLAGASLAGCALGRQTGASSAGSSGSYGVGGAVQSPAGLPAPQTAGTKALGAGNAASPDSALSAGSAPERSAVSGGSTAAPRLVTHDVTLRLRVKDVATTARQVSTLAAAAGGWVESMQIATDRGGTVPPPVQPVPMDTGSGSVQSSSPDSGPLGGYVRVRVPAAKLERFRRDVSAMGDVVFESTNAQDVTAQHIDMRARLDNLKSTEASLRRLMERANTVGEVLAVQNQLTQVQGEIESLTAQLAALDQQLAMSAVTVELAGPAQVVSPAGDDWGFVTALRDSLRAFVYTTNGIIVWLGAALPLLIILGLVAWFVVWLVRRSARRRAAASAGEVSADGGDSVDDDPGHGEDDEDADAEGSQERS